MPSSGILRKILDAVGQVLCSLAVVFLTCYPSWAAGLSVPAGSTLNVRSNRLNIAGDVNLSGSLSTTSGTVALNGSWVTSGSGTYQAGTGTVRLTGTISDPVQTLTAGTVLSDAFYHLVHEGTGTVQLATNPVRIRGDFTNNAGTFDANSVDISLYGNWTNAASFSSGNGSVVLLGADQGIYGSTTFYNLRKQLTTPVSRQVTFQNTVEQQVTNQLTLLGYDASIYLLLRSDVDGTAARLTLNSAGQQNIRFVDVKDNNASGFANGTPYVIPNGLTLVGRSSPDHQTGWNNSNWLFNGVELKWDGSNCTAPATCLWNDPYNWNLGMVPGDGDSAVVRSVDEDNGNAPIAFQPVLTSTVQLANLEVRSGAAITLDQHDLTVSNALTNNGNLILDGNETVTTASLSNNGTVTYVGSQLGALNVDMAHTLLVNGTYATTFYNLVINEDPLISMHGSFLTNVPITVAHDLAVAAGSVIPGAAVTVTNDTAIYGGSLDLSTHAVTLSSAHALAVSAGTLNAQDGSLDVGSVTISGTATTFSAPDSGGTFTVAGNFTNTAAPSSSFDAHDGTLVLDGTDQAIYGQSTFYNLSKVVPSSASSSQTLLLESGREQTVTNSLTLTGLDNGSVLTYALNLEASTAGTPALLTLLPGGAQNIRNVDVTDNNAGNGLPLIARGYSPDHSDFTTYHNTNWMFGGVTLKWDGSGTPPGGTDDTNWENRFNWDLGVVPEAGDTVIIRSSLLPAEAAAEGIASIGAQPQLTAAVTIAALTLREAATTLTLDGQNLTVNGILSNAGNIVAQGSETIRITTADTLQGTFTFTGNNIAPATPKLLKLSDPSVPPVPFFNLVIADTGTAENFAFDTDAMIYGSLSVSGGALNLGGINLEVDGGLYLSGTGSVTAPGSGKTLKVGADFSNTTGSPTAFAANNGTLTLDGVDQAIYGSTLFYTLVKAIPVSATQAQTLTFQSGAKQTVEHQLTLTGLDNGSSLTYPLNIRATAATDPRPQLVLLPGGAQDIRNVDAQDNDASPDNGITLVARGFSPDHSNVSTYHAVNWAFGSTTIKWDGTGTPPGNSDPSDWSNPYNWDRGLVPQAGDTVIIRSQLLPAEVAAEGISSIGVQPLLTAPAVMGNLTLRDSGSVLTLDGFALTASGVLTNYGNIIARGSETIRIAVPDIHQGTFTYTGDDTLPLSKTLKLADPSTNPLQYFNLVIADTGTVETFAADIDLAVYGNLSVSGGRLDLGTRNVDVNGSVALSGGNLTAPGSGLNFNVGAGWSNSGGVPFFTANGGRVSFDSSLDASIYGSTTFYDLSLSEPAGKNFFFEALSNQTVVHALTMSGAQSHMLVLRSTVDSSPWTITVPSQQFATYVDVKDSTAAGPLAANIFALNSIDRLDGGGNTTNPGWQFGSLQIIYPAEETTVGQEPVIIGQGISNSDLTIVDNTGAVVATARSDIHGNFRTVLGTNGAGMAPNPVTKTALDISSGSLDRSLTVYYQALAGNTNLLTVVATPTVNQVPIITSPVNNERIAGSRPTIQGQATAGATVVFIASDADGNLLLTMPPESYAGQSTVGTNGQFSFKLTTPLPKGTVFVSAVVNGVSSPLMTYSIYGLYGTVLDSSSAQPLKDASVYIYKQDGTLAVPNVDLDPADTNPMVTGTSGAYHFLPENGSYYLVVSEQGYKFPTKYNNSELPAGLSVLTGSRGEVFPISSVVTSLDLPLDASDSLFRIEKTANKSEAKIGEVVTYSVSVESLSSNMVLQPKLHDIIPPGFKFIDGRVLLDNVPAPNPAGNRPLTFDVGDFAPRQKKTVRYQLVIGSGVVPGTYENTAYMKYINGLVISNLANRAVKVVMDPLFDLGTVFGKVFYDYNGNGRQDAPDYIEEELREVVEGPVPNVRIVMEDGTIVTTDKNGQFHIPKLLPGRHLLRVDESSLPPGTYVTNDKVQVIDVTAGSLVKANFGVNLDNAQAISEDARFFQEKIQVQQDTGTPVPKLNVDMFNKEILFHNDAVIEQQEFRIFMNYAPFIQSWRLDIVDKDTKKLVRSFSGNPYNIRDPIYWDGRDSSGKYIRPDWHYSYYLKVMDGEGHWDETIEKDLVVRVLTDQEWEARNLKKEESALIDEMKGLAKSRRDWIAAASKVDAAKQQNIRVVGETLRIDPQESDLRQIRVLKDGQLYFDIPLAERHALTAMELVQGSAQKAEPVEIILPNGEYELEVLNAAREAGEVGPEGITTAPEIPAPAIVEAGEKGLRGRGKPKDETAKSAENPNVTHYRRVVKVGEDRFLFVAMGDGKVGYNINRGSIEPIQANDKYLPGFYQEGKMAYYLKGKIKGKYIVTSSFDSERQQKEMFRGVKEDEYYPIYGDSSTLNYDATNTLGPLYLLVEWDKSQAIWGNYAVDFKDTEFARYTRTLYGGKVDYTSVSSTKFGDPRTKIAFFHSQIRQRSSHNEFLGTGGSLYYLKHQGVVPGSDIIKLEVRDSVTGQVRSTTAMKEGVDYRIDYAEGRILFWQPVSMSADKGSIIANSLLAGDPIYVVADYEYYVTSMLTESTRGTRVAQAVTDNVTVGGTYVSETQAAGTYELKGQDVTVKTSRDTTIRAEYAQTTAQDAPQYLSTDGGISFSQVTGSSPDVAGKAYGLRHDTRLFDRVGMASYYKWVDPGFSTADTTSQQGKELKGINLTFDLTPVTRLTSSYDIQRLIEQGNLQTQMQVGAMETRTTVVQLVHQARRLRLTWEFRNQQVLGESDKYVSEANQKKNTAAFQAQYALNEKTDVTLTHQADFIGRGSQQTSLALRRQLSDDLVARLEETFGTLGTGTKAGLTANVSRKLALTTEYGVMQYRTGERVNTSTVGMDAQLGKNFSMKTAVSQSVSTSGAKDSTASAVTTGDQVSSNATQTKAGQTVSVATKGQITDTVALETSAGVTRAADGSQRSSASVLGTTVVDNANVKAGVSSGLDAKGLDNKTLTLGASRNQKSGSATATDVKLVDSAIYGKETIVSVAQTGQLGSDSQLTAERTFGFGRAIQEKTDTYKITKVRDGRKLETSWGKNYALRSAEHSTSNIFGLTGDINDKWAASATLEQGRVQNADGSRTNRLAASGGVGYVRKDPETGTVAVQSSTKLEGRFDSGGTDKTQFLISHATDGRVTEETTLTGKFEYSQTRDNTTDKLEAQYKQIVLGVAYRPISNDRLNMFGKYTYKDNLAPTGQANTNDVEAYSLQVLSAEGVYEMDESWQMVERLAYRVMEEKVAGFDFYRTHTWLLVNRLNYRLRQDWKIGGEYRVLVQQEAQDRKDGFLIEATHGVNDNVEIGIGYNFTQFVDDLTNLDYTVAGPFIRMTGKLYDRSPEERARARAKWIDHRVEQYAWKMVARELKKTDSPVFRELNEMYHLAEVLSAGGDYEEARRIYKDVILGVQMMFEEAAQFVRKHIAFEEKLFNAQQRAREYYDKGEYWMAKKIWEKIVEEASRAMLK